MENKYVLTLVHASTFFAPVVVPIIVLLLIQDSIVKRIAIQALLFHILMGILITLSAIFSILLVGIPFLIIFIAMAFIVPLIGIVKSLNGEIYEYPILRSFM